MSWHWSPSCTRNDYRNCYLTIHIAVWRPDYYILLGDFIIVSHEIRPIQKVTCFHKNEKYDLFTNMFLQVKYTNIQISGVKGLATDAQTTWHRRSGSICFAMLWPATHLGGRRDSNAGISTGRHGSHARGTPESGYVRISTVNRCFCGLRGQGVGTGVYL